MNLCWLNYSKYDPVVLYGYFHNGSKYTLPLMCMYTCIDRKGINQVDKYTLKLHSYN